VRGHNHKGKQKPLSTHTSAMRGWVVAGAGRVRQGGDFMVALVSARWTRARGETGGDCRLLTLPSESWAFCPACHRSTAFIKAVESIRMRAEQSRSDCGETPHPPTHPPRAHRHRKREQGSGGSVHKSARPRGDRPGGGD
jgi:hypothetical protein